MEPDEGARAIDAMIDRLDETLNSGDLTRGGLVARMAEVQAVIAGYLNQGHEMAAENLRGWTERLYDVGRRAARAFNTSRYAVSVGWPSGITFTFEWDA